MRQDFVLYDDSGGLMLHPTDFAGKSAHEIRGEYDDRLAEAVQAGLIFPVMLMGDNSWNLRVVLDEPLNAQEAAEWVCQHVWWLTIPGGQLSIEGAFDPDMADEDILGDMLAYMPVPPGDYRVEVYTYLPQGNAYEALERLGMDDPLAEWFERTRPGETLPLWLMWQERYDLYEQLSDEDQERAQSGFIDFVARLTPLADVPPLPDLDDGWMSPVNNPRLPEQCPLGLAVTAS